MSYSPRGCKDSDTTEGLSTQHSGSAVKNPSLIQETRVLSLGQEDPLEKEMATYSSILAWKIPWTEEPGGYSPRGHT